MSRYAPSLKSVIFGGSLIAAVLPQVAVASPNLITNGSFENGATDWTSYSGSTIGSPSSESYSYSAYGIASPAPGGGTRVCEIEKTALTPTTINDYDTNLPTPTTTLNEIYFFSGYGITRPSNNTGDKFYFMLGSAASPTYTTSSSWQYYTSPLLGSGTPSTIRPYSAGSVSGPYANPGDGIGAVIDVLELQELTYSPTSLTTQEDTSVTSTDFQIATNTSSNTSSVLTVALSVTNGTLQLASTSGLTITSGSNNSSSMTFTGTATNINTALTSGLTYVPSSEYNGSSTLTYTATTASGTTDTDVIPITVTAVTDATNDNLSVSENGSISYNPITGTNGATADNFEGTTPTITAVSTPAHGTATYSGNVITYTPNTNYVGTDSFTYTATSNGMSETATETMNVRLPSLTLIKTSNGFAGSFTYTGANWAGQTITTTASGVETTGATVSLTQASTTTTIVEALNTSFIMTSASCSGLGSGTATVDTTTGTITLNSAATNGVNDIVCSIVNTAADPQLSLTKTTTTSNVNAAGTAIPYTITVQNTGNVTINSMTVTDALGTVICPTSGNATIASLAPNASQACTMSYTVPQSVMNSNGGGDGKIENTASVSGTYASQTLSASASNSVNITITSSMSFSKTANTSGPVSVGDIITYTFTVTNTGNVTLSNVTVDDPAPGTGSWSGAANETLTTDNPPTGDSTDAVPDNGVWSVLAPNDVVTFTATYTVAQSDINNQ